MHSAPNVELAARRSPDAVYEGALGFARASDVAPDTLRDPSVLRARTHPTDAALRAALEAHRVALVDDAAPSASQPTLRANGFEAIDLRPDPGLRRVLDEVATRYHLAETQAQFLRRWLRGRAFPLGDGRRMRLLFVADEGIIFRSAGPEERITRPDERMSARNGHRTAAGVHVDQDVRGTPLRQMLLGLAPYLFHHTSPDGRNHRSPLHLVNVWIPLQQITRPLALLDGRTFDRRRHQARYALPTDEFFSRRAALRMNDIWSVVPDASQRWHFRSEMPRGTAYVFDTLSTAHGAFSVPGESEAGRLVDWLRAIVDARRADDAVALASALERAKRGGGGALARVETTPALGRALAPLASLLDEAFAHPVRLDPDTARSFEARVADACEPLIRKSIELRCVAWVGRPRR